MPHFLENLFIFEDSMQGLAITLTGKHQQCIAHEGGLDLTRHFDLVIM